LQSAVQLSTSSPFPYSASPTPASTYCYGIAIMLALHIALYVLLGTALAFAIIELGLSAYIVSGFDGTRRAFQCNGLSCGYYNVKYSTPGILAFLIFTAVWTMLISVAAALLPWFFARRGTVTAKLNMILGIVTIVVYFITSVFWLACFADIVNMYGTGSGTSDYLNAVIAFAVLLWWVSLPFLSDMNAFTNHMALLLGWYSSLSPSWPSSLLSASFSPAGLVMNPCARNAHRRELVPGRLMCLWVQPPLLPPLLLSPLSSLRVILRLYMTRHPANRIVFRHHRPSPAQNLMGAPTATGINRFHFRSPRPFILYSK